jgi:lethal(2) giant larvae protein
MFKFATNKFNGGGGGSGNNNNISNNSNNSKSHSLDTSSVQNNELQLPNISISNAAAQSRRRQIIHKDLFAFNRIADKGFPSKPSAMDYDKKLKLLAIGTKNGDIRIYGSPGSNQQQLSCYQDVHPFPIQRILFIQGHHQLITLSERIQRNDMTNKGEPHLFLVLWQIPVVHNNDTTQQSAAAASYLVEKIKEFELEPEVINGSRLSAITLLNDNSHMFLGFETGDVYVFNVAAFQLVPGVINKDFILKNLLEPTNQPSTSASLKKLTQLGAVESICHHPRQLTKLLIAYQRGLWIIFDFIKNQIDQMNQTSQQLESAVFYQAGECVATSHSDGSFILWDLENQQQQKSSNAPVTCSSSAPNIVYGPYPCKSVNKCLVKTCKNDQPYVIFSGGCPRINYSDKITISVIQGENSHVCFDFTSKIIDYFTIDKPTIERQLHQNEQQQQSQNCSYDNPQALFVLLEEEFVAIDLCTEGWPQYKLPYLYSVHSSAIICTHYVNNVSGKFYDYLKQFGNLNQDSNEVYSDREWPISSLNNTTTTTTQQQSSPNKQQQSQRKDLLLTGHEDGSVRFWDVTNMSMTLIYRLKTSDYFQTDSNTNPIDDSTENPNNEDNDNWPPFRKVGTFDPYSDDPKLGIQKIYLCAQREILVVAGTAGQVLIMSLNPEAREYTQLRPHKINLIGSSPEVESCFVWKGHEPLLTRTSQFKLQPGYQLQSLVQLYPPATVSALALSTDWQLVSMGTSHGFALFDYLTMKPLLIRCTLDPALILQQQLNPNDSGNYGHNHGNTISRRKSLKKSLRESFRKLRRGRSQKPQAGKNNRQTLINTTNQMRVEHIDDDLNGDQHRPIERQVESREFKPMDDIPPSVIRYMYFVRTFITNSQQLTNSLWVGTNTGIIYIYALQFMPSQHLQQANKSVALTMIRTNQVINCLLAKEMRLKHRAPVVNIQVIDQNMQPLPLLNTNDSSISSSSLVENHKVIICSEEQFKVFQLPTLKPVCKFKLTAVEGARVRRIGYNSYTSRTDPKYTEHCLSCLSNLGDISVYSLPQLKRQVQMQCMKQQDINAITSFVFSKQGQAFYLQSPSEFVHISMSARDSPATLRLINNNKSINNNTQAKTTTANSLNNKQKQETPNTSTNLNSQVTKPRQQTPTKQTKLDSNATTSLNIESPSSPPPPVPAPRTILPKDELPQQQQANISTR